MGDTPGSIVTTATERWAPADLGRAVADALRCVPDGWTRPSCNPALGGWRVESLLIQVGSGSYRRVRDSVVGHGRDMERAYLNFRDQWERRGA